MEQQTCVCVKLLFFAKSRELVGEKSTNINIPERLSSRELFQAILQHYPSLTPISENLVLSLNEDYLELNDEPQLLSPGDELAIIPPISGAAYVVPVQSMNHVEISKDRLSIEKLTTIVTSPRCGAISSFIGTTRDNFNDKTVVKLEYEAYDEMAKKKMLEVCEEIRTKWEVENIAIEHRIGIVPVTESSIIIAISSAHRSESLEAVHYAINRLKQIVPIWKKEVYDDETSSWKQNKECAWRETELEDETSENSNRNDKV